MNPTLFLSLLQGTSTTGSASSPAGTNPTDAAAPSVFQQLTGGMFVPMILCLGVFWFLMIRPEQKNRKKRAAMLAAIAKGDKVMTNSGLYGTVVQVQDQVVTLLVAEGVRMRFALSAIQSVEQEGGEKLGEAKTT